jgi:hypothetical protein
MRSESWQILESLALYSRMILPVQSPSMQSSATV